MTLDCSLELASELSSVTVGRHFVRDVLLQWNCPALVEDAELGASELVANAVRHARTGLVLRVTSAEEVVIAIEDGEPELRRPLAGDTGPLAEHGRGLHIVAAISRDWGVRPVPGGKVIWFSLRNPDWSRGGADVYQMAAHREARRQTESYDDGPLDERVEGWIESAT